MEMVTIPGPTVRLTQGDTVHVTILNPTNNTLIHSYDSHASTISAVPNFGPINPGASKNFTFILRNQVSIKFIVKAMVF